jgi:hypothetical protein
VEVVVGLEVLDGEPRVVDLVLEHEVRAQVVAARLDGGEAHPHLQRDPRLGGVDRHRPVRFRGGDERVERGAQLRWAALEVLVERHDEARVRHVVRHERLAADGALPHARHPHTWMQVIVDNSAGGDSGFADAVAAALRGHGLAVEVRAPDPTAMFDTAVHLISTGLAIRVTERPDRATLGAIEEVVRGALIARPSLRRRTRSVPVHLGETARVLEWIDVFD